MKLRLILSFISIALISIIIVVLLVNYRTTIEVRDYLTRGGGWGTQGVLGSLIEYYQTYHTWNGVEELFSLRGHRLGQEVQVPRNLGIGRRPQNDLRIQLADEEGLLIVDTRNEKAQGKLSTDQLEHAIPIQVDDKIVGYLYAEVSPSYQAHEMTILVQRLNNAALIAVGIAVFIAVLIALFLSNNLLKPIQALTNASVQMSLGDLNQRVNIKGWGELDQLGQAFNSMAESLQKAEERRRQLTADIAHELRTPLAVQRAQLEAIRDGVYECSSDNIHSVLSQNELLTRLVEDLRTLTLADSGELRLELLETDLLELVQQVVARFNPQAEKRQISISVKNEKPIPPIWLDRDRIAQILGNLLSNALRYTPPQGEISISLNCTEQEAIVMVKDSGPGIPPESLPFIFDRFYRADQSRSRSDGGSGLGLTIAKKIAQLHRGSLTAQNHPAGGSVFILSLPVKKYASK